MHLYNYILKVIVSLFFYVFFSYYSHLNIESECQENNYIIRHNWNYYIKIFILFANYISIIFLYYYHIKVLADTDRCTHALTWFYKQKLYDFCWRLCIMTSHRYQHNLTFNTIKNGNKEYIAFLLKKKVLLIHTELFVRHMVKIL